jgi:hypothetical protein
VHGICRHVYSSGSIIRSDASAEFLRYRFDGITYMNRWASDRCRRSAIALVAWLGRTAGTTPLGNAPQNPPITQELVAWLVMQDLAEAVGASMAVPRAPGRIRPDRRRPVYFPTI